MQLCRLMPALKDSQVIFVTSDAGSRLEVELKARECGVSAPSFYGITEANRWQKLRLIRVAIEITLLLMRVRPDVVISTGAAPGYIAVRVASMVGIRTIWLDSIANSEVLSLSGRKAGLHADLWLTQWEHLALPEGPHYLGTVV